MIFVAEDSPRAIVLAEPAAWKHRNNKSNQYASVGTSASPTHEIHNSIKQIMNKGRLPIRSDKVPHSMGAVMSDFNLSGI